jgi:hypothetical protein
LKFLKSHINVPVSIDSIRLSKFRTLNIVMHNCSKCSFRRKSRFQLLRKDRSFPQITFLNVCQWQFWEIKLLLGYFEGSYDPYIFDMEGVMLRHWSLERGSEELSTAMLRKAWIGQRKNHTSQSLIFDSRWDCYAAPVKNEINRKLNICFGE